MSETAVATVTLSNGAMLTNQMTPLERHNAVAASLGAPTVTPPRVSLAGPQGHPHVVASDEQTAMAMRAEPGTIGGKAAPPTPAQLEAANKPGARPKADPLGPALDKYMQAQKIAKFDQEMRDKGLQTAPTRGTPAAGEVDQAGVDALNAGYKSKMAPYLQLSPSAAKDRAMEEIRAQYNEELREFMVHGRRLSETRAAFKARQGTGTPAAKAGAWSTPGPDGSRIVTPAGKKMQKDLLDEFDALPANERTNAMCINYMAAVYKTIGDERGLVHSMHLDAKYLSGYALPKGMYSPEVLVDLARAKAAGFTQAQVNAVIASERIK